MGGNRPRVTAGRWPRCPPESPGLWLWAHRGQPGLVLLPSPCSPSAQEEMSHFRQLSTPFLCSLSSFRPPESPHGDNAQQGRSFVPSGFWALQCPQGRQRHWPEPARNCFRDVHGYKSGYPWIEIYIYIILDVHGYKAAPPARVAGSVTCHNSGDLEEPLLPSPPTRRVKIFLP